MLLVELGIVEYLELSLWIVSMGVMLVVGILFVKDYKKLENTYFLWLSMFFFLFIVAKILRIIVRFYIGEPPPGDPLTGDAFILESVYTIVSFMGLFFVYYALEKNTIKKTHYFFSTVVWITAIASIIDFITRSLLFITGVLFVITILGLPIIFIYLGLRSNGAVRRNSFIVAGGIIMVILSIAMDIPDARVIFILPELVLAIVPPALLIMGCILLRMGFQTKI